MRRYPDRRLGLLDLDRDVDLAASEPSTSYTATDPYHVRYPDRALAQLAAVCPGMILLETVVLPGNYPSFSSSPSRSSQSSLMRLWLPAHPAMGHGRSKAALR